MLLSIPYNIAEINKSLFGKIENKMDSVKQAYTEDTTEGMHDSNYRIESDYEEDKNVIDLFTIDSESSSIKYSVYYEETNIIWEVNDGEEIISIDDFESYFNENKEEKDEVNYDFLDKFSVDENEDEVNYDFLDGFDVNEDENEDEVQNDCEDERELDCESDKEVINELDSIFGDEPNDDNKYENYGDDFESAFEDDYIENEEQENKEEKDGEDEQVQIDKINSELIPNQERYGIDSIDESYKVKSESTDANRLKTESSTSSIPSSIEEYVRVNRGCTMDEVLKYFKKCDLEKSLLKSTIYKQGKKLFT